MQHLHKIILGISSCLLGQEVRYDGGHKKNTYITNSLANYFEFVPVCPEAAIGMGIPRPPVRLIDKDGDIRVVGVADPSQDFTDNMRYFASRTAQYLTDITGYIFKKDSPSCGMERVKVFDKNGMPEKRGTGLFAEAIIKHNPLLPVEEEGRLQDPALRENFIERVFIYYRWQQLLTGGLSVQALVEFHSRHKFNVLSHDQELYRRLGRIVADAGSNNLQAVADNYIELLMQALKKRATRKNHTNVLMHIMGFIKNQLDSDDKQELLEVMEAYRNGMVPLIVPITLFRHHLRRNPHPYIEQQYYMKPYPEELMLRNNL